MPLDQRIARRQETSGQAIQDKLDSLDEAVLMTAVKDSPATPTRGSAAIRSSSE